MNTKHTKSTKKIRKNSFLSESSVQSVVEKMPLTTDATECTDGKWKGQPWVALFVFLVIFVVGKSASRRTTKNTKATKKDSKVLFVRAVRAVRG